MRQGPSGRRPRGRPNRKQHGGPPRPSNFDSNGPEGRVRGNAHQVYERYIAMARDALSAGDRIAAETYYQHAEHYFRIINSRTDPLPAERRGPPQHGGNGRSDGAGAGQPHVAPAAAQLPLNGQDDGADAPNAPYGQQPRGDARHQPRPRSRPARGEQAGGDGGDRVIQGSGPQPDIAPPAEPEQSPDGAGLADGGRTDKEPAAND